MTPTRTLRGEELLAWPVLLAISITVINDHLLKAACPGLLTGKVSDFSGLFFFPFLLTAIAGRIHWLSGCVLVTGIGFVAIKLVGLSIGPFRIVPDLTDLIALVSLPLAVLYGRWRWLRGT